MQGQRFVEGTTLPEPECSYQAADQCTGFEPLSCCERLSAGAPSQMQISTSVGVLMILISMALSIICKTELFVSYLCVSASPHYNKLATSVL